jgi:prolyl-tRNA editing enzyme YbaK/EbsC (Cys-tRNA(Pro) deacylase)
MLDRIVAYLHSGGVPFRVYSYPSPEDEPKPAHPIPPQGILVDARFVIVDGRLLLVSYPEGEQIDLAALSHALGGPASIAAFEELPTELQQRGGSVPPLGELFGAPLVLDERVPTYGVVVFRAFSANDYVEVSFDDFARMEVPKVAAFAYGGELPEHATSA